MIEEKLSPKVKALYDAVTELIAEEMDIKEIKVSDITGRAGIGKGTAYEYFNNKEEIISNALIYHINRICSYVMEELDGMKDFSDMIHFILDCMDKEIMKSGCFMKFVHLMTDNGATSRKLQAMIREKNGEICMPEALVDRIISKGIAGGSIKNEFPHSYMKMSLMAKLIAYAFYTTDCSCSGEFSKSQMHDLVCDSLIKEFN